MRAFIDIGDEKEKLSEFLRLIAALPAENRAVAAELCHFLSDVASHSAKNKMGAANLATIFGPSLLAAPNYALANMGEEMALANLALVTVRLSLSESYLPCIYHFSAS